MSGGKVLFDVATPTEADNLSIAADGTIELGASVGDLATSGDVRVPSGGIDGSGYICRMRSGRTSSGDQRDIGFYWGYSATRYNPRGPDTDPEEWDFIGRGDWEQDPEKSPHVIGSFARRTVTSQLIFPEIGTGEGQVEVDGFNATLDSWYCGDTGPDPLVPWRSAWVVGAFTNMVMLGGRNVTARDHMLDPEEFLCRGEGVFHMVYATHEPSLFPTVGSTMWCSESQNGDFFYRSPAKQICLMGLPVVGPISDKVTNWSETIDVFSEDVSTLADGTYEYIVSARANVTAGDDDYSTYFSKTRACFTVTDGTPSALSTDVPEELGTFDYGSYSGFGVSFPSPVGAVITCTCKGADAFWTDWRFTAERQQVKSTGTPYFNPATLNLTGWWRDAPATDGLPPIVSWSGTRSNGTSASHTLAESTNPPAINNGSFTGHGGADFDGADDILNADGTFDTYVSGNACSGWVLFMADTATTDAGAGYRQNNPQFFAANNGSLGVGFSSAGIHLYVISTSDGQVEKVISCGTTVWHLLSWRFRQGVASPSIQLRLDGGAWQSTSLYSMGTGMSYLSTAVTMGGKFNASSPHFDGSIAEQGVIDSFLDDTTFDNVVAYINARYGLSF